MNLYSQKDKLYLEIPFDLTGTGNAVRFYRVGNQRLITILWLVQNRMLQ